MIWRSSGSSSAARRPSFLPAGVGPARLRRVGRIRHVDHRRFPSLLPPVFGQVLAAIRASQFHDAPRPPRRSLAAAARKTDCTVSPQPLVAPPQHQREPEQPAWYVSYTAGTPLRHPAPPPPPAAGFRVGGGPHGSRNGGLAAGAGVCSLARKDMVGRARVIRSWLLFAGGALGGAGITWLMWFRTR